MNIDHYEKNFRYSDLEHLHAARKLGKLATYCKRLKNEDSCIKIEVERRETKKAKDEIKVIVLVELPDKVMKADSRKDNCIEALDRCVEKLETQLKKYKEKRTGKQLARKVRKQKAA